MKKLNQKGFTGFEIALLVLVLAALGFASYTVWQNNKPANSTSSQTDTQKKTEKSSENDGSQPTPVTFVSCEGNYQSGPVQQSKAEPWKSKLSAAYTVYSVDQVCGLSNKSSLVTFKVEESPGLPAGIAVFDASNNLLRHKKITCKSLGGEGARLYVDGFHDKKIEASCISGHAGQTVTQGYSFDYDTLTPTLVGER